MSDREILAELSYAVGRYVECDERPRPAALWAAMATAQQYAAVHLNTSAASIDGSTP